MDEFHFDQEVVDHRDLHPLFWWHQIFLLQVVDERRLHLLDGIDGEVVSREQLAEMIPYLNLSPKARYPMLMWHTGGITGAWTHIVNIKAAP